MLRPCVPLPRRRRWLAGTLGAAALLGGGGRARDLALPAAGGIAPAHSGDAFAARPPRRAARGDSLEDRAGAAADRARRDGAMAAEDHGRAGGSPLLRARRRGLARDARLGLAQSAPRAHRRRRLDHHAAGDQARQPARRARLESQALRSRGGVAAGAPLEQGADPRRVPEPERFRQPARRSRSGGAVVLWQAGARPDARGGGLSGGLAARPYALQSVESSGARGGPLSARGEDSRGARDRDRRAGRAARGAPSRRAGSCPSAWRRISCKRCGRSIRRSPGSCALRSISRCSSARKSSSARTCAS